MLAPAKIEEMYKDPDLVVYHDVISDKEMAIVKGFATPLVSHLQTVYMLYVYVYMCQCVVLIKWIWAKSLIQGLLLEASYFG